MHEFSIALSIVDLAQEEVEKADAQSVESIELEIGEISGVEIDSLNFVWDAAVKGTVLHNAVKNIHISSGEAVCLDCQHRFHTKQYFNECPECNSLATELKKGRELRVKSLTVA